MLSIQVQRSKKFSLDQSLSCGQVFRWDRSENGWWYGVVEGKAMKVRQEKTKLSFEGADGEFIEHYFSLDVDLEAIVASFDRDSFIHAAVMKVPGTAPGTG